MPESERGEQREAMEQFELNKSGNESQQDRDVAQLQREFPNVEVWIHNRVTTDVC